MDPSHSTLLEFERQLSPLFREVALIGERPLSDEQGNDIEEAIHALIRSSGPGWATQFLREHASCTLACFLVWKGRDYHKGDYWTAVCQPVGLPQHIWPQKWGEIFKTVLRDFELADFQGSGGLRFVTPILIHGGIPDYCLADFFEHLLWPVVEGKLDYDGSSAHLITEWQKHSAQTLATDIPVRRFLENGGKIASDFLQRSLDMAMDAPTGSVPGGENFGLPGQLVERFSKWLEEKVASPVSRSTHRQTNLPRYRAPEIDLDPATGCLLFSFPPQRVSPGSLSEGSGLTLQVRQGGNLLTSIQLPGTPKGEMIETSELPKFRDGPLGEKYEFALCSGDKRLRVWTFSGVSSDHPWMIFHGISWRLLDNITERDFWLVFRSSWEISTTIPVIEEAEFQEFQAKRFRVAEGPSPYISLADEKGHSLPVPVEWRETPILESESAFPWPRVSSGEFAVYLGTPPRLLIPLPSDAKGPTRLHLTIIPMSGSYPAERKEVPLENALAASKPEDRFLRLSLEEPDLLGPNPCGRFIIRVRGRLGQDRTFHICILPEVKFHFPAEKLLPDSNTGSQPLSFTVESARLKEGMVEPPAEGMFNRNCYRVNVPAESDQVSLKLCFDAGETTVEVPLEMPVSRLRWALSGLAETASLYWSDQPLNLTLQELQDAQEASLLVRGDLGQDIACSLSLAGADHRQSFELKNGKGGCPLLPFLGGLGGNGLSRNDLYLDLTLPGENSPRHLCSLRVEIRWRVEDIQVKHIFTEDRRTLSFNWHDKGKVKNRALRVWNLDEPQRDPVEVTVEDNRSDAEIERSLLPHGLYRLELIVRDPFAPDPSEPPSPYGGSVFDLELREGESILLDSPARHMEALLDKITSGEALSALDLDFQTVQAFVSQSEQARTFCKAVLIREESWGDSNTLFRRILQQCGERQHDFAENLAGFLIDHHAPDRESILRLFAGLYARWGFLGQPWKPSLKKLLLSDKGGDLLSRHEKERDNSEEEILALYEKATWQSLEPARRFLQRLLSASGELAYEEQRLLKLEGIVPMRGEKLLRWSCEKKIKRRIAKVAISVSLKEVVKIRPRRLAPDGILCLTATLQRAGAYRRLRFPEPVAEKIDSWGHRFYQTHGQAYRRHLEWAEESFRPPSSG